MNINDVKKGMKVRFHPIIGGKHDGNLYTITNIGIISGDDVIWLDGKAGCVAIQAISKYQSLSCPKVNNNE